MYILGEVIAEYVEGESEAGGLEWLEDWGEDNG